MPKRTLNGFLKNRLAELGGPASQNPEKLCQAALGSEDGKLADVVFLLALEWQRLPEFLDAARGMPFEQEWKRMSKHATRYKSATSYLSYCAFAPKGHKALFAEFEALCAGAALPKPELEEVRLQIIDELDRTGTTRYRLCKDLGLNIGNTYAFLKGDLSKSGLANARRMLDHLNGL